MRITLAIAAAAVVALALGACGDDEETGQTIEKPECDFEGFEPDRHSGQVTGSGATQGLWYFGSTGGVSAEILHFSITKIETGNYEFAVPASYVDLVLWTGVSDPTNPWENHEVLYEVSQGTVEVTEALGGIMNDTFAATLTDVKLEEEGVEEPRVWCLPSYEFQVEIDTGP